MTNANVRTQRYFATTLATPTCVWEIVIEDPAWQYINRSDCPRGFDKMFCPERFKCNATVKVIIDVLQVCDQKSDCDDNSETKLALLLQKLL